MNDLCVRWVRGSFEMQNYKSCTKSEFKFCDWLWLGKKSVLPSSFLYWFPLPSLLQDVSLWSAFLCGLNKAGIIYCVALANGGLYIMKPWCNFMKEGWPLQQRLHSIQHHEHIRGQPIQRLCLTMICPLASYEARRAVLETRLNLYTVRVSGSEQCQTGSIQETGRGHVTHGKCV